MLSEYVRAIMDNNLLEQINNAFYFDLDKGIMYWKNVSKYHSGLNGTIAGNVTRSRKDKLYWVISFNGKKYKRSRLIYLFVNKRLPIPCVDHINGDSLDDRPINLREVTVTQNNWNHKGRKKKTDLPMGVRTNGNKYVARISHNKKQITIGTFNNLQDAHQAYLMKRNELYGQYSGNKHEQH